MRGVTAALGLVLAACSTAGGDTATTAVPAEPSTTTSTAAPTTTTTEPTTTTSETECVDRDGDGVLRTRRGFVCPPYMRSYDRTGPTEAIADIHLPGTYTLRQFTPAITFTRTERFRAYGENVDIVEYDSHGPYHRILSGAAHENLAAFPDTQPWTHPDHQWKSDIEVTDTTIDGYPATITGFTADCPDPDGGVDTPFCRFDLEGVPEWAQTDGQRTAVIVIDLPSGPFTIVAQSPDDFDTYWTEVAQPILDSIEYLDP